jgi:hypothetical protein
MQSEAAAYARSGVAVDAEKRRTSPERAMICNFTLKFSAPSRPTVIGDGYFVLCSCSRIMSERTPLRTNLNSIQSPGLREFGLLCADLRKVQKLFAPALALWQFAAPSRWRQCVRLTRLLAWYDYAYVIC